MSNNRIYIRTSGQKAEFFAVASNKRSIDFFRVDRPNDMVASIVDFDDSTCMFLRYNKEGLLIGTQEKLPNNTWSYGSQYVKKGFIDQTEIDFASGKTFIFRDGDIYPDLNCIDGTTIGFAHAGRIKTNVLCRCYVSAGILAIQFAA